MGRIASWNCRKGLMLKDNTASPKLDDIKSFLMKYDIHVFGLLECNLHGAGSRIKRSNPISTRDALELNYIPRVGKTKFLDPTNAD